MKEKNTQQNLGELSCTGMGSYTVLRTYPAPGTDQVLDTYHPMYVVCTKAADN